MSPWIIVKRLEGYLREEGGGSEKALLKAVQFNASHCYVKQINCRLSILSSLIFSQKHFYNFCPLCHKMPILFCEMLHHHSQDRE